MISRLLCSPGLQRFYTSIRRVPVAGRLAHELVTKLLPPGARLPITVSRGAGAGLFLSVDPRYEVPYATGDYEEFLLKDLASRLRTGDVLYDVGAHVGFISLFAARLVGSVGKIYAFEADEDNSTRLLEHREMNSLAQIEVVRAAVWSESTKLSFRRASDSSGRNMGSVAGIAGRENVSDTVVVEAVTLDNFVREHRPPTVVKVDVEGAEEEVLAGAEGIFRRSRPALICEIHNAQAAEGVRKRLAACGYGWDWLNDVDSFPRHLVATARG
jgi:FkbM family methyltransferase